MYFCNITYVAHKINKMKDSIFKFTMNNGLVLGMLFIINFFLSIYQHPILGALSNLMTILIVYLVYRMAKRYRDMHCGGSIKYGTVFSFVVLTFIFASLVSAVMKIIYFQYINPEFLINLYEQTLDQMEMMLSAYEEQFSNLLEISEDELYKGLERLKKPSTYTLYLSWVNIISGAFLGLILAFFVKKEKSIFEDDGHQAS